PEPAKCAVISVVGRLRGDFPLSLRLIRESCEFLVSTSERGENPPGAGEVRDSSLPRNLILPERLPGGHWGLRRFRIASGQKTRTVCPRSAKRAPLPSERTGR